MNTRLSRSSSACLLVIFSTTAEAQLINRGSGLIYDDQLDITWLRDADLLGQAGWESATDWAAELTYYDSVRDITYDDWRLPTTLLDDASCSSSASTGTNCTGSEMGHLFNIDGISIASPGPFINIRDGLYWSSTLFPFLNNSIYVNSFGSTGQQDYYGQVGTVSDRLGKYAWAVRSGDVIGNVSSVVPVPAAAWLFGSGILGIVGFARRRPV